MEQILTDIDPALRPVRDSSQPVQLKISLTVVKLVDLVGIVNICYMYYSYSFCILFIKFIVNIQPFFAELNYQHNYYNNFK